MIKIDPSQLTVIPIDSGIEISSFFCSDNDLNNYLKEDALRDHEYLYSITKIVMYQNEIVGYFTLVTDTINPDLVDNNVGKKYEYSKLPAVKIARLATDTKYIGQGIGRAMMIIIFRIIVDFIADIGCRVITVDAKRDAVGFYQRFAFSPVSSKRKTETVPMYLDIKPLYDAHKSEL